MEHMQARKAHQTFKPKQRLKNKRVRNNDDNHLDIDIGRSEVDEKNAMEVDQGITVVVVEVEGEVESVEGWLIFFL